MIKPPFLTGTAFYSAALVLPIKQVTLDFLSLIIYYYGNKSGKTGIFMKISIRNEQKKVQVTKELRDLIKQAIRASLDYMEESTQVEVSVLLVDNEEIHTLNKLHRGIDRATDVLSFPLLEYDENGDVIEDLLDVNEKGEVLLGDIVISLERAVEQASEYGHTAEREVGFLTVHSMLHLLGYDHMTPEEEAVMFGYQNKILIQMGLKR